MSGLDPEEPTRGAACSGAHLTAGAKRRRFGGAVQAALAAAGRGQRASGYGSTSLVVAETLPCRAAVWLNIETEPDGQLPVMELPFLVFPS